MASVASLALLLASLLSSGRLWSEDESAIRQTQISYVDCVFASLFLMYYFTAILLLVFTFFVSQDNVLLVVPHLYLEEAIYICPFLPSDYRVLILSFLVMEYWLKTKPG